MLFLPLPQFLISYFTLRSRYNTFLLSATRHTSHHTTVYLFQARISPVYSSLAFYFTPRSLYNAFLSSPTFHTSPHHRLLISSTSWSPAATSFVITRGTDKRFHILEANASIRVTLNPGLQAKEALVRSSSHCIVLILVFTSKIASITSSTWRSRFEAVHSFILIRASLHRRLAHLLHLLFATYHIVPHFQT